MALIVSLPEAIAALRETRRAQPDGAWISVSGADPLNLAGIIAPGPRLAALTGNRLLYRDGIPIALLAGGEVQFLEDLAADDEWQARKALVRGDAASTTPAFDKARAQEKQTVLSSA